MTTSSLKKEYDIVFAGGGAAACVTAGRLAKADPNLSILLIEQGGNNLDEPSVITPALFLSNLLPGSKSARFFTTNVEGALGDRGVNIQSGGILGGGSSINFLAYTRASAVDFDSWKTPGWDAESMMALANKAETHQLDIAGIDPSAHGQNGPIHVSNGAHAPNIDYSDIFAAAEAVGVPKVADMQDFKAAHGFERWRKYIGPDGKRQDTAHCFIHPLMKSGNYPNLHILVNSNVIRVIFDGIRAVGVEYEPSAKLTQAPVAFIAAKKLVVLAAGALGTAPILERSGVGSSELLRNLDIDVISDLPGVGADYQDHQMLSYNYKSTISSEDSLDGLLSGREDFLKAVAEKSSKMAWNGIDVGGKLRPSDEEVAQLGSDFQARWERDFKQQTTRPLVVMGMLNGYLGDREALKEPADNYMAIVAFTAYPYSRGSIHIVSKDAQTPASFTAGFLSDPVDLTTLVWAYKKQREIMRRSDKYAGEVPTSHPAFPKGSKAACLDCPAVERGFKSLEERVNLPLIEYDEEDDRAIEKWIRTHVAAAWHALGTCKMAPREKGGVVDKDLNVYGTEGLKCGDLSIIPENVGANTYNTALIVGEKAAAIIGKELGLVV